MKVKFFDISWDTDGERADLPSEVTLTVDDDTDLEEQGADILSDKFGWCVNGLNYEVHTEGKCPKCKADLEYDDGEVQDESYFYRVSCPSCEWSGLEWYDLVFDQHTDK